MSSGKNVAPSDAQIAAPDGYRQHGLLGRGGMGAVYRATELATGREVALKRLLLDEASQGQAGRGFVRLFEREYHTLSQLAHPRIIAVYDYAVDDVGPYYTMELLAGSDLRARAPLPWREACALLRDVASSLGVLHSRRLIHRDVSPGNVRCTPDGRAKLIDFGAMVPAGVAEDVVGTPPCVPPEALYGEELDARSDLFALGATLYLGLTERHAYPTRALPDLPRAWRTPPEPPSRIASDVPEALDALVLSLLSLRPEGRPASAAEVIERLEVIAGLAPDASNATARAYLATPALVGRDGALARYRDALKGLRRRRSLCQWVEGAPGLGRTRLLDAMALESRLAGVPALHARAGSAPHDDFGIERSWVRQLLRTMPDAFLQEASAHADALAPIDATLRERLDVAPPDAKVQREPLISHAHAALRTVLVAISRLQPLALLVDDVHAATSGELAFLVGLARELSQKRILLVVTAPPESEGLAPPLQMLRSLCADARLEPFSSDQTRSLLASIFADPPELDGLVAWMHGKSEGNPAWCLETAQHLVDIGSIRHAGGVWLLPNDPSKLAIPESLEQMRARRLAALSPDARAVARALALLVGSTGLDAAECATLLAGADRERRAHGALSELESGRHVVDLGGGAYELRETTDASMLAGELADRERHRLHDALARIFEARGAFSLELAYHLQHSERGNEAYPLIIEHTEELAADFGTHRAIYAPAVFRDALACARRENAAPVAITTLVMLNLATRLASGGAEGDESHGEEAVAHLRRDTGADIWAELPDSMAPLERTQRALALAAEAHEALPEERRGMPPGEAVARLSDCIALHLGILLRENRAQRASELLDLLRPFVALSPVSAFYARLIASIVERVRGRECRSAMRELLDQTERGEGLDRPDHRYMFRCRMGFQLGGLETLHSADASRWLAIADDLCADPLYAFMGWQIRLNHALAHADALAAAAAARERNLALAQSMLRAEGYEASCLLWDVIGYARLDDLVALKRLQAPTAALARRHPGWAALAHIARAEYAHARGDLAAALDGYDAALAAAPIDESESGCRNAARACELEARLGRAERAVSHAQPRLALARSSNLDHAQIQELELALGLAEAMAGQVEGGIARIEHAIAELDTPAPAVLGHALELLARAAVCAADASRFIDGIDRALALYRPGLYASAIARCERLEAEGRRALGLPVSAKPSTQGAADEDAGDAVRRALDHVAPADRLDRALALLLENTGASAGCIFRIEADTPTLVANTIDGAAAQATMREHVAQYVEASCETALQTVTATLTGQASTAYWPLPGGGSCLAVPLGCPRKSELVLAGVACLVPPAERTLDVPWTLAQVLADYLLDTGDLVPVALPSL